MLLSHSIEADNSLFEGYLKLYKVSDCFCLFNLPTVHLIARLLLCAGARSDGAMCLCTFTYCSSKSGVEDSTISLNIYSVAESHGFFSHRGWCVILQNDMDLVVIYHEVAESAMLPVCLSAWPLN